MSLFKCDNCEALSAKVNLLEERLSSWRMSEDVINQFMWRLTEFSSHDNSHLPTVFLKKIVDEIKGLQLK